MSGAIDEAESLSRKLAVVAALRIAFVTVSLGASFALTDRDDPNFEASQFTLISVAYGVSLLYVLAFRLRVAPLVLAYLQVFVDALLVTLLVGTTGGIESVFTAAFVFVVIGAAITLFRRGAVLATGVCLVLLGTMAVVQVDGGFRGLPRTEPSRAALTIFTTVISLSLVAALASTLSESARATGRRLAERESDLMRLEALHAAILRSLPAGLVTVDLRGIVRFANEAAYVILQLAPDEVLERPIEEVMPSMAAGLARLGAEARAPNPRERFEGPYQRPDRTIGRIGFSFAPLGDTGGSIVVFQDLTEIVRLKEAFERAERLATIGKLSAALAHEIRNPLSAMCASIDVLKATLVPPENMRRLMDNVVREGDRLNKLITDFLSFAKPREPARREVDLVALCQELVELWRHDRELGAVALELEATGTVNAVVDPDMLRQVLWNLARNSAQAMAGQAGGLVRLIVRAEPPLSIIGLRDNGPGMPPEVQKRIFDPFYTTKTHGTGLGLAIAHAIVEAHGGTILVSSQPGEGTEMILKLPTLPQFVGEPEAPSEDILAPQSISPPISVGAGQT